MAIEPNNTPKATPTVPAVYVNKLSFRYRSLDDEPQTQSAAEPLSPQHAIEDISFSLDAGKLMLIAGPSGCGKSTLLKWTHPEQLQRHTERRDTTAWAFD
jgi:ABC-type multidrug transport system fused ATPase/permease subunit